MNEISTSPKMALNAIDIKKTGRYLLVLLGGTLVSFLIEFIASVDFGKYQSVVVLLVAPLLELARRWLTNQSQPTLNN